MKKEYITIFLVIIAIVLGIIFYLTNKPVENKNTLQYTAGCGSDKIDASVYSLKGNTSLIGAFISFDKVPISENTRVELDRLDVYLDENSWIFDYVLAQIPTESLCDLAEYDFIKGVFIPLES